MTSWIGTWWLDFAFGAITGLMGIGFAWMRHKIAVTLKENAALKAGIKSLLRDRIVQAYEHYSRKGCWPLYSRDAVMDMYEQYRALGGNGVISDLVDALRRLPADRAEQPPQPYPLHQSQQIGGTHHVMA